MLRLLTVAVCLSAAGLAAVHGNYIEARTADVYTGACFANAEVGHAGDLAVFGWNITKGQWQGVDLAGLSVVGVVRASHTLGDVYHSAYPVKSVLIVDTKADAGQRRALMSFARHMGGDLLQDVVRVDYQPIRFAFKDGNVHSMTASMTAGDEAKIETRPLHDADHICKNEEVWYAPLNKLAHAMPAYTVAHSFQGEGLGTRWSSSFKRSAFVGTFRAEDAPYSSAILP